MAPPMIRRSGWSRRAQYSLFFGFVALVAGAVLGLVLLTVSLVAPRTFADIRGAAIDATRPIAETGSAVAATVEGLASGAGDYWDAAEQNAALREERDELRRRLIEAEAVMRENIRLKQTIGLVERSREPIATGRIIGSSQDSPRRFAVLSVGSENGVANGMPVRSSRGLIGRVVDTGRFASRVLLVSDRANVVPAKLLRTDEAVIAKGRGDGTIDIRPLEVGRNPFRPGDIIATSGTGGLYPPLVPVAKVIRLDDDGAIAVPMARPAESGFAIVEPPFEPAALASDPLGDE
ncbi:rod shape-determining protein MreC [Sphingomicrobium lutaoense]|uniref:Cell shape-determining protein MreC n=1 Tax=Sphingomicrobium lutaoense TaxID=515949 RepID=A0A839Z1J2_9SPHN|nr:rod shape-determining protein MreC [Sphingomicrobium lutaoense]MBB3763542.1 rod shape-determining protein MreC [Sphingomicrobium lutaoense]